MRLSGPLLVFDVALSQSGYWGRESLLICYRKGRLARHSTWSRRLVLQAAPFLERTGLDPTAFCLSRSKSKSFETSAADPRFGGREKETSF